MYISETKKGKPVKAQGFRVSPWEQQSTEFHGNVIVAENAAGVTVRRCPTWEAAVAFVRTEVMGGRAVFRAYDPNTREWVNRKVYYRGDYKGDALVITHPPKPALFKNIYYKDLVAKCDLSVAPATSSCYQQAVAIATVQAPTTKASPKPTPRAKVEQPGVGYYLTTTNGSRITNWMFRTMSAACAYAEQQGFAI